MVSCKLRSGVSLLKKTFYYLDHTIPSRTRTAPRSVTAVRNRSSKRNRRVGNRSSKCSLGDSSGERCAPHGSSLGWLAALRHERAGECALDICHHKPLRHQFPIVPSLLPCLTMPARGLGRRKAQRSAVQHYHDFTMVNGLHLPDPGAPASPPIASFAARARCSVVGAWILCQRLNDDDLEAAVRCPFRSMLHLLTLKVRQLSCASHSSDLLCLCARRRLILSHFHVQRPAVGSFSACICVVQGRCG